MTGTMEPARKGALSAFMYGFEIDNSSHQILKFVDISKLRSPKILEQLVLPSSCHMILKSNIPLLRSQ